MENSKIPEKDQNSEAVQSSGKDEVSSPSEKETSPVNETSEAETAPVQEPAPDTEGSVEEESEQKEKKEGIFRWKAIIAIFIILACLGVFNIFFLDDTVKSNFSIIGNMLTNTKTAVKEIASSLLDLSFSAKNFYLVDPDDIYTNFVTAENFEFAIEPGPLFEKKLHIKTIKLQGVKWNTARDAKDVEKDLQEKEAALEQELKKEKEDKEGEEKEPFSPDFTPILERLSKKVTIRKDELFISAFLENLEKKSRKKAEQYAREFENLHAQQRISNAESILQECSYLTMLKKKDLKNPKTVKKAQKDIKKLKGTMKDLKKLEQDVNKLFPRIKQDAADLEKKLKKLPDIKNKDLNKIREKYTFGDVPQVEIAGILFGRSARDKVTAYMPIIKKIAKLFPKKDKKKEKKKKKIKGQVIEFTKQGDMPGVLIEEIVFSGEKEGIKVEGIIKGLSSNPKSYGKPCSIHLSCSDPAFTIDVLIDRTKENPEDHYTIEATGLLPGRYIKVKSALFPFTFDKGRLNIKVEIERSGKETGFSLTGRITGSKLSGEPTSKLTEVLKRSIEEAPAITFSLTGSKHGKTVFDSNLDSIFNKAFRKAMRITLEQKKAAAEKQLESIAQESLKAFHDRIGDKEKQLLKDLNIDSQSLDELFSSADALETKFKEIKKQAQKELKKKEKEAKKKLEKKAKDALKDLFKK